MAMAIFKVVSDPIGLPQFVAKTAQIINQGQAFQLSGVNDLNVADALNFLEAVEREVGSKLMLKISNDDANFAIVVNLADGSEES
jgi:hypothetical protein